MKEKEELELILKLLVEFNLPLSPILDYAIREKIEEYSKVEGIENDDLLENVSSVISERKSGKTLHIEVQRNNNILNNSVYYQDCKIENKANQCFIINKNGKRIYSSTGKLKILDEQLYRILYNYSAITINIIQWDEKKEKYRLGERIVYERKNSLLYEHLNKANYLEQITAIMYEDNVGEYRVKVDDIWYSCIGEKSDEGERESVKPSENPEQRIVSSSESPNNPKCDMEIIDFTQRSIAVIGHTKPHKDSFKAMGGLFMYRTKWGPAWVFSAKKREKVQAYINGEFSAASSSEDKGKEESVAKSHDYEGKETEQGKCSLHFDIRVQYPNGSVFCSKNAGETLADVILYAGFERVRQLNIDCLGDNLVSTRLGKNSIYKAAQKEIARGIYVCISSSKELIYRQILMINERCHLGLIVEKGYCEKTRISTENRAISDSEPVLHDIHSQEEITYSFNGIHHLSKCRFVLEVVKEYVRQHPRITYESLLRIFPATLNNNSSNGVFKLFNDVMYQCSLSPNYRHFFFLDDKDIIVLKNGVSIVVHNQWDVDFDNFLKVARCLFEVDFIDQPHITNIHNQPVAKKVKGSKKVARKHGSSVDRRIGYTIRLLPSQQTGEIIGVRVDHEGYKRLVIRTKDYHLKEIEDNPYLYIVLKRKK